MTTTKKTWEPVSLGTLPSHVLRSCASEDLMADFEKYWSRRSPQGCEPPVPDGWPPSRCGGRDEPMTLGRFVALVERAYLQLLSGNAAEARRTLESIRSGDPASEPRQGGTPAMSAADAARETTGVKPAESPARIVVRTLGTFDLVIDGRIFRAPRKQPARLLALLKAIIALGGTRVCGSAVADVLWPDLEGDSAHNTLCVTLHRLRDLLGVPEALAMQEGRLSLDPRHIRVDAFEFDTLSRESRQADDALLDRGFDLYRGPFLPEQSDLYWTSRMRERLRCGFARLVTKAAVALEENGRWADAAVLYERALAVDDAVGALVQPLARYGSPVGTS